MKCYAGRLSSLHSSLLGLGVRNVQNIRNVGNIRHVRSVRSVRNVRNVRNVWCLIAIAVITSLLTACSHTLADKNTVKSYADKTYGKTEYVDKTEKRIRLGIILKTGSMDLSTGLRAE